MAEASETTVVVTDEAVGAARARWVEMWGDGEIDRAGEQMIDDVLAAAAPLIAAQALRSALSVISGDVIGVSNADDPFLADALDMERISFGKVRQALNGRADELERGTGG